ncbi:AraC family transcriptional regulator, partial [Psychrobacter celer]
TQISLHCGYSDHSAFSRQFKQFTGISPTQFRHAYLTPKS